MLIVALGGWNHLVMLPDPESNRQQRRASGRVRRSLGEGGRCKKNG